jgi:hypothetical protein
MNAAAHGVASAVKHGQFQTPWRFNAEAKDEKISSSKMAISSR